MKARIVFLIVFLFLIIQLAKIMAEDTAALGISDYEVKATVTVGEARQFEVARIKNEGTLNLTVTVAWLPEYNTSEAQIELLFYPQKIDLASQEAAMIYVQVLNASQTGNYTGLVQFTTDVVLPSNASGSHSIPGGTAHAEFHVVKTTPPPSGGISLPDLSGITNFLAATYFLPLIIPVVLPIGVLGLKRYRGRPHMPKPSTLKIRFPKRTKNMDTFYQNLFQQAESPKQPKAEPSQKEPTDEELWDAFLKRTDENAQAN